MSAFRTAVKYAVSQVAIQQGIVPSTTLAAPISIGGTTFTCASSTDAAKFTPRGLATFWDGTNEFPVIVQSVAGAVVTCTFTGRYSGGTPITGFQHAHSAGALIATNIIPSAPNPRDGTLTKIMLANGYPVLRIWSSDVVTSWPENQTTVPKGMVNVVYQLEMNQPHAQTMPPDLWLLQQADRADADMQLIIAHLQTNWDLTVNGTSNAEFVEQFMQAARQNPNHAQVPLFEDYLDIVICGLPTGH